ADETQATPGFPEIETKRPADATGVPEVNTEILGSISAIRRSSATRNGAPRVTNVANATIASIGRRKPRTASDLQGLARRSRSDRPARRSRSRRTAGRSSQATGDSRPPSQATKSHGATNHHAADRPPSAAPPPFAKKRRGAP